MLSSTKIKDIVSEARPIIERQLDDAERIAAFRDVVAANGGDWSALKALIKAQIQDERDESGDGKRVRKILEKADFSTGYADMLGWSNMNEKNFSAEPHDPETGEILESVQSHEALVLSAPAESASGEISAANQESAGVKLAALASSDPHEADESGSPIHEPDATTSRPEPAVNPAGHIDTPATGQASDQTDGGAIGGVMDAKCRLPDAVGVEPSPSVTFINPKCLKPKTCPNAHSKTACFDCVMEYGKRPTDEQKRLWAEAIGVAVV